MSVDELGKYANQGKHKRVRSDHKSAEVLGLPYRHTIRVNVMARMSIRATYALDEQTDQSIKRLAKLWRVSQAEVIRRSVQTVEEQSRDTLTPAEVVARYASGPLPRSKTDTKRVIQSLRTLRHTDDKRRTTRTP